MRSLNNSSQSYPTPYISSDGYLALTFYEEYFTVLGTLISIHRYTNGLKIYVIQHQMVQAESLYQS